MSLLEAAFRGGAVALLVFLAARAFGQSRVAPGRLLGGLLSLSVAAYVICSAPGLANSRVLWLVPLRLVNFGTPVLFWLWASMHFDDEFELGWRHAAIWAGLVLLGAACAYGGLPLACIAHEAATFACAALVFWHVARGRGGDLIEERRLLRLLLVGAAAGYSLGAVFVETVLHASLAQPPLSAVNALVMAGLAFGFAVLAPPTVANRSPAPADRPGVQPAASPESAPNGEEEARWLRSLERVMTEDKAFRAEGFSIGGLAERLQIPEYRLRRLINQRLGHRNFTSFVNGYRLAEVKTALADPAQAAVPVLTIALDAGFQSLGPFNRAFKRDTGMTPTEFRRLGSGDPKNSAASSGA
jgi:AraC-like DNA-binding protein